jgi:2-polyprenyl-6-methoxyphenol hydroxylase-like FAD-dependent oxidoreductase
MAEPSRTLIVGGGIAGLTLAAALHAKGFEVDLIERNSTW